MSRLFSGERRISVEMLLNFIDVLKLDADEKRALLRAAQQENKIRYVDEALAALIEAPDVNALLEDKIRQEVGQRTEPLAPFLAPKNLEYDLVGRDSLLSTIKQRLFDGESIALTGLPGAGKTALAVTLAHDPAVRKHFTDGILWAKLGVGADDTAVAAQLTRWANALSISSDTFSQSSEQLMDAIQDAIGLRHMLLVVDDAWSAEAALNFKLGGPNSAHLLTTRHSNTALDFAIHGRLVEFGVNTTTDSPRLVNWLRSLKNCLLTSAGIY